MIFDLLAPGGGAKNKCAVAHPIHVSNSHTKFGLISSNGLGGDNVTDGRRQLQYPRRFFKKSVGIIISKCMHCLQACLLKCITAAAFHIYAQRGEGVAERGGWRPCIK